MVTVQQNLFPVRQSLCKEVQNDDSKMLSVVSLSMQHACLYYIILGISGALLFGKNSDHALDTSISVESQKLEFANRLVFMITIVCQLPYLFFNCREPFFVIIDEIIHQTTSKILQIKSIQYHHSQIRSGSKEQHSINQDINEIDEEKEFEESNIECIYKKMSNKQFVVYSLILFCFLQAIALVIGHFMDIQFLFDIMSAISSSSLICIFPGIFYLLSLKYAALSQNVDKDDIRKTSRLAKLYVLLGIAMFSVQMSDIIIRITSIEDGNVDSWKDLTEQYA